MKHSKKYKYTESALRTAVATSATQMETMDKLGIPPNGGNYVTTRSRILALGIDTTHFLGSRASLGRIRQDARKLEDYLVLNGPRIGSSALKPRLIKAGLLEAKCSIEICPINQLTLTLWCGHPVPFELDHINGDPRDNRIENLRILCGHCHAQTDTFCGKNRKVVKKRHTCADCGKEVSRCAHRCGPCAKIRLSLKVSDAWPSDAELISRIKQSSTLSVARELKVSFNALKKHLGSRYPGRPATDWPSLRKTTARSRTVSTQHR